MQSTQHARFEDLANEHKDVIYRQMLRACGNREDAKDVLIEALLKAYCSMEQFVGRDSVSCMAGADRAQSLLAAERERIPAAAP